MLYDDGSDRDRIGFNRLLFRCTAYRLPSSSSTGWVGQYGLSYGFYFNGRSLGITATSISRFARAYGPPS